MQHHEFVGQVQARAQLADVGAATSAIRATLQTLGERIPEGLAGNVAADLPREIGEYLRMTAASPSRGVRFDKEEFLARVSDRAGMSRTQASDAARVVLEVAGEATQGRVMEHLQAALPADLRQMVRAG
ncbi:DUF2267 domain-containing protein [Micromonospora sp. C28SCA-DRY-2]|uniref:DUF2267 domain-containing protein n=1 Tax=Micromonospora sp. C28SCA-DRY-2 TaxID=3059522 RepID=UPI0026755E2E|nr:DUF2267 domain-containing protein [Micromonospora sp. C28SCA-DRY-2]MDO3702819.1 DUF2267 domain-containing protein [Micromonospora sp. C28SCA-DRY-2]